MKLFKPFTLKWWQLGLLKLSLICLGIIIGISWPDFFLTHPQSIVIITILFILPAIYISSVWWKRGDINTNPDISIPVK